MDPSPQDLRPIRVLCSARQHSASLNQYLESLTNSLSGPVELEYFTWRCALTGQYDLLHIHWPEILFKNRKPLLSYVAFVLCVVLLVRLQLVSKHTRVVWTVHNDRPHEDLTRYEDWLLRQLISRVDHRIYLSDESRPVGSDDASTSVIVHGVYPIDATPLDLNSKTFLAFGMIRPYKRLETLISAFRQLGDPTLRLRIVGPCSDPAYADLLASLSNKDERVTLRAEFLEEEQLIHELALSRLVVLPYAASNSGAVLYALSAGRPVLVPESSLNAAVADEVGSAWVHMHELPITGQDIKQALATPPQVAEAPDLSLRQWPDIGQEHVSLFERLVAQGER